MMECATSWIFLEVLVGIIVIMIGAAEAERTIIKAIQQARKK